MKILIIKLGAGGDVLRTTSILPPLVEKYPRAHISWLVREKFCEILKGNPFIDRIVVKGKEEKIISKIDCDIIINLDEDLATARMVADLGCKKLGFYSKNGRLLTTPEFNYLWRMGAYGPYPENDVLKKNNQYTYQQILYRSLELGNKIYRPVLTIPEKEYFWARKFCDENKKYIGINFSSSRSWTTKRLPLLKTIELAKQIKKKGAIPVIFGAEDEKDEINFLRKGLKKTVFVYRFSFKKLAALVKECKILITTDSLTLHIASALGTNIIALFGPTSASEVELYSNGKKFIAPASCRCCYKKKCDKTPFCMELFDIGKIVESIGFHKQGKKSFHK